MSRLYDIPPTVPDSSEIWGWPVEMLESSLSLKRDPLTEMPPTWLAICIPP